MVDHIPSPYMRGRGHPPNHQNATKQITMLLKMLIKDVGEIKKELFKNKPPSQTDT